MQGWWRRDPFFVRYMVREATAVAVLVYAVVLTVGAVRLAQGEQVVGVVQKQSIEEIPRAEREVTREEDGAASMLGAQRVTVS